MRLSLLNLKEIIKKYQLTLVNKRIADIVLVNSRLFLFTLKNEKKRFLVDLDNNNPHIGLILTDYNELSLPSEFIAKALMKGTPLITGIELANNDKVIKITTTATDAYYHHNKFYLYIELINAHANMILTDENNKIIVAFYETNLTSPRLIIKTINYILPDKKNDSFDNPDFSFKKYEDEVAQSFILALEKRKKELYGPFLKKYEKKVKSLEKKINKINESIEHANDALKYKDIGDTLLISASEIKKGDTSFQGIKLDPTKSAIENANMYFSKYKKAKRTFETTDAILKQINQELEDAKYYLDVFTYGKEDEIKLLIKNESKSKKETIPSYLPYYINWQNVTYYFGHNALENDYLTFKMFKKSSDVIWLHIKDKPSAHLIINKSNPTNLDLDIACSLLLLKNKLTAGEIIYTSRKNLTRANQLAKVNILRYKSITMHKVNPLAYDLLKREKRVHE
ncbi:MAG: NFACT family protein [Bacilli bacterium]|nr:NFACT family protein [Bacilli bacterium]